MYIVQESADKIGLNNLVIEESYIAKHTENATSKYAIKINDLLNVKLPVDDLLLFNIEDKREVSEPFSLTDIQYAYLIGRNAGMTLGGIATRYYFETEIFNLDLQKLNEALNQTIAVHPMLSAELTDCGRQRASFTPKRYEIAITDCASMDEKVQQDFIKQTRNEMETHLNSLETSPPFDIRATLLNNNVVRLHLCFELMFLDLHSVKILMKDWWGFYKNAKALNKLPEFGFVDYIYAEKNSCIMNRVLEIKTIGLEN